MKINRFKNNPIITPDTPGYSASLGTNINGPSLIRVPSFIKKPLGKYYLYFAHHNGDHIRLAFSDDLAGPWRIYEPGTLRLEQTRFKGHIASPDVHVDKRNKQLVMYYHGCCEPENELRQPTLRATSKDGLAWVTDNVNLGYPYFRVFFYDGWYYAISFRGRLYRSGDGKSGFEDSGNHVDGKWDGNQDGHGRHWAVLRRDNILHCFFTRWGDAPEHIVYGNIDLRGDWRKWQLQDVESVLYPELDYEGANQPIAPSKGGSAEKLENQLRDPYVFEQQGKVYLLYSVAGEAGIAISEVLIENEGSP